MVQSVNYSDAERFERAYRRIFGALRRPDDVDLTQHEASLLAHIPPEGGVPLTWLAGHLALPKSTTSVLVKDLERRGFLRRRRDDLDERRLSIVLTDQGRERVTLDTVLDPARLAASLGAMTAAQRSALLHGLEQLADLASATGGTDRADGGHVGGRRDRGGARG